MRYFHAHHTIMIKKMFTQSPTARFAPSSDRKTWIKFVDAKESKDLIKKFEPILPFGNPSTDFASESSSIQIRRRENGRDFIKNIYNFRVCVSPYYWHLGQMKRMACALTHTDTHLSSNTQTMKSQKKYITRKPLTRVWIKSTSHFCCCCCCRRVFVLFFSSLSVCLRLFSSIYWFATTLCSIRLFDICIISYLFNLSVKCSSLHLVLIFSVVWNAERARKRGRE